jgi:predicted 3-demethylubiquinone-9 3-methyltransferase (glyoxalase superfamily)
VHIAHYTEAAPREPGTVMTVEFELTGQRFTGIDGGPEFTFDEAVLFQITVEDQDELDHFWEKLSEGRSEGPCGWLKDKYELSWQLVPAGMEELFFDPDPARARRAMEWSTTRSSSARAIMETGWAATAALRRSSPARARSTGGACPAVVPRALGAAS